MCSRRIAGCQPGKWAGDPVEELLGVCQAPCFTLVKSHWGLQQRISLL